MAFTATVTVEATVAVTTQVTAAVTVEVTVVVTDKGTHFTAAVTAIRLPQQSPLRLPW